MKKTIRLDESLLRELKDYLHQVHGTPRSTSRSRAIAKATSYLLYNTTETTSIKGIISQRLQEIGATEEDYLKGKVRTWARETKLMDDSKPNPHKEDRLSPKLQETLKEVIREATEEEDTYIQPSQAVFRETPEEIEEPTYNSSIPPWETAKQIKWKEVEQLYSNKYDNPFLTWPKNNDGSWDEVKCYAIKVALAHIPPQDRTTLEAWKLIYELEERFLQWKTGK